MRSDILLTPKWKQETLVSIVSHSLSGCVSGNPALSLGEPPSFPGGGSIFLSLHSDWLSGLEKEASIFQMASNSFVILEINL